MDRGACWGRKESDMAEATKHTHVYKTDNQQEPIG